MPLTATRSARPRALTLVLTALVVLVASCSGGSGGSAGPPPVNELGIAPPSSLALVSANGSVQVDWQPVPGASSYVLYWSSQPGVDPSQAAFQLVGTPPAVVGGLTGTFHVAVASVDAEGQGPLSAERSLAVAPGSPEKYFPAWSDATPKNVLSFDYDPSRTSTENGSALAGMLHALLPGDRLELGSGRFTMTAALRLSLQGTAQDPIWIVAKPGARPVIARDDANQNTLEFGNGGRAEYVCMRGIEITGGDIALRLYDCNNLWFDQCDIHHCNANAIAANSVPTHHITFTRNQVHHTSGSGEGFYIGGNNGDPVAHDYVIALNHVYACGGTQGDGIEIKQGSWGNWVAENLVHDTNYPCILVGGTNGRPLNLIERNVCYGSNDNVMQVQGEAIVRNNALFDGAVGFHSSDHQGATRDLVVVHNTIVNGGRAVNLSDWSGRPGMVFSNNACYSANESAVRCNGGSQGVEVQGNVVYGPVSGLSGGFVVGAGLSDFAAVNWVGTLRNVTPSPLGALVGAADPGRAPVDDLSGALRSAPHETGAREAP